MKAKPTTTARRPARHGAWLCAFLVLALAMGVAAGDPDDDWGLPTVSDGADPPANPSGGEPGPSQASETPHIRMAGEVVLGEVPPTSGRVLLDRSGHVGTGFVPVDTAAAAEVASQVTVEGPQPLRVQELGDGLLVRGEGALLQLGSHGQGSLRATLQAPEAAVIQRGFLVLDQDAASLQALLATDGTAPAAVTAMVPLGAVSGVDLNAFQQAVETVGQGLHGTHVSLLLLSRDAQGKLHLAAARLALTGGPMEIVAR